MIIVDGHRIVELCKRLIDSLIGNRRYGGDANVNPLPLLRHTRKIRIGERANAWGYF